MENTSGPIKPFITGKLPKDKYSDPNELAHDIANALAIDEDKIVINLVALESLKGEKGDTGPKGSKGNKGEKGDIGPTGSSGNVQSAYQILTDATTVVWTLVDGVVKQNAQVTLTANRSLVMSNAVNGAFGTLLLIQDSVGGHIITLPVNSKIPTGSLFTSTPNAIDKLDWTYDGTNFFWTLTKNFV